MKQNVQQELAVLKSMTATELRGRYRALFGAESRSGNRQWLFRRCAWRVQALAEGNLTERLERMRERASQIANDEDMRVIAPRVPAPDPAAPRRVMKAAIRPEDRLPVAGTVLERPFKGRTHVVKVLGNGFEYDNRVYRSLTAVAHAISGSHWNGFNFFREQLNYAQCSAREEARHG